MGTKKIDWNEVEIGTWFKAEIDHMPCIGQIQKENGQIFLCQNDANGHNCEDRLGNLYSWGIRNGSANDLKENNVLKLKLLDKKPKNYIPVNKITLTDSYEGIFKDSYLEVGCQKIPYSIILEVAEKIKELSLNKK